MRVLGGRADHPGSHDYPSTDHAKAVDADPVSDPNAQIEALLAIANRACRDGAVTRGFEPIFVAALDFLQHHPACHAHARHLFITGLEEASLEWELIAYCMHELQWPEVRTRAVELMAVARDWRARSLYSHIVQAFEDDWPDVILYERWRARRTA